MSEAKIVGDMVAWHAEEACGFARDNLNVTLDYAEESVEIVEAILDQLHKSIPGRGIETKPSFEQFDGYAKMFGGYVGEVMRRKWGGHWKLENSAIPGQRVVKLELTQEVAVSPQEKVSRRILHGAEHNVWLYFQMLKHRLAEG